MVDSNLYFNHFPLLFSIFTALSGSDYPLRQMLRPQVTSNTSFDSATSSNFSSDLGTLT